MVKLTVDDEETGVKFTAECQTGEVDNVFDVLNISLHDVPVVLDDAKRASVASVVWDMFVGGCLWRGGLEDIKWMCQHEDEENATVRRLLSF